MTDHISEYSRQILKDDLNNNQRAILKRLRKSEEGSSYQDKPMLIKNIFEPIITPAQAVFSGTGQKLWKDFNNINKKYQ